MSWQTVFSAMLPEHLLLLGMIAILVIDVASRKPAGATALSLLAVTAAACAAFLSYANGFSADAFPGHFSISPAASLGKAVVLAMAIPVVLMSRDDFFDEPRFAVLMLSSLYGFCLMLSSDSFLTLFLGLELMSVPVYVLVLIAFQRPESAEAALKYLVLGGVATAMFLMGASLLYGRGGSLALSAFVQGLGSSAPLAIVGVTMVLIAFFLKEALVPFHAWAPDAYEAASVPVTAYMATIVKAGVLLAVLRLFGSAEANGYLVGLLVALPLISIVWGNLTAMKQASFRRMIAYSSITHAGYLFYAFLGAPEGRYEAIVFYVIAYGLLNLLAFACLPGNDDDVARDRLDNLKGLFHRQPYAALMIGIAMLSLAGIPPFPGFVGKFLIFKNVMAAGYTTYAVLGLLGSYLGIYFYLRVIQFMFMSADAPAGSQRPVGGMAIGASVLCLAATTVLSLFPGLVIGRL